MEIGTGAGSSFEALCNVLQIPVSKVDLVGDEVGKSFYNKEYAKLDDTVRMIPRSYI